MKKMALKLMTMGSKQKSDSSSLQIDDDGVKAKIDAING